jgi:hypothetical protein
VSYTYEPIGSFLANLGARKAARNVEGYQLAVCNINILSSALTVIPSGSVVQLQDEPDSGEPVFAVVAFTARVNEPKSATGSLQFFDTDGILTVFLVSLLSSN